MSIRRAVAVFLVIASFGAPVHAQTEGNPAGKACLFHPKNGDPVPVADGDTYTPRVKSRSFVIPHRWLCKNGKLVIVE